MSLRFRIAAGVALVVVVVVAVVGIAVDAAAERELVEEIDLELVARARAFGGPDRPQFRPEEVADALLGEEGQRAGPRGGVIERLQVDDTFARVIDESGAVVANLRDFTADVTPELLAASAEGPVLSDGEIDGARARVVTVPIPGGSYVQIARSLGEIDQSLADLRIRIVLIGLVATALATGAAWVVAARTARPIVRLTEATSRVASTGDLETTVDGSGGDEVGRLADSFNGMLAALSASRQQQHQLVMDASHELRTPLTSLRTNIDVLRSASALPEETRSEILADVHAELGELGDLVAELVDLAADVRESEPVQPMSMSEVVEPVVERARRRTGRPIEVVVEQLAVVEGRPQALGRAVRNLIDNAAKFSPDGTPITVVVDGGEVVVHDSGSGIPADELDLVFERFHRVEATRTLPGSGLGLAIVRQVAEVHDGNAFASDSPNGGAAVGFRIPTVDD